ncbi:disintegrin and metalloproteinase domain-containing protein 8 isoform X1 [Gallus gallus]|uniref:disintegrin and metalloproteinase domain-containing protein 8 isoform X1 n=1 Tax=Gallus gallus TaxID=9031 RepID=UPI001AE4BD3C|nr:disintegrin and metalloproteinase domain-containing protein 8 isoform X1 [Gallus gallus]
MAPPLAVLRLLLGLLLGRGVGAGLREELAHVERYETTVPRRVPSPRAKRDLSVSTSTYPERVLYSVCAEGRDYLLHLEKNRELLGQRYTETHYLADGTEVTVKPDVQDHCFYQGHVEGHANSAASISTCSGLSGFFRVNETVFLLKPLDEHEAGQHAVYRASHLRMKRSACLEAALEYDHDPKIAAPLKLYRWKSARLHRGPRYVELVLVVDNEEFRKYKDLRRVQNRMKEIVNHVDKLYQSLGLRVALIGLEVWSNRDKITVSRKAEETLENFLRWREMDLLKRKQHDNVQLITGIDFHDTTVGLAKKLAMCTRDSGGVNQDHSVDPIGAASTLAHEMGHNLGMSHDEDIADCHCPVSKERGGCVMAAKISSAYPRLFSTCSEQDMWQFLEDPKTSCLLNVPGADELYGEPVCGNQFVERGEECDCGRPEECSDRCCNATTCRLREGAECARGDCCQDCKVKAAGVLCRASKNDCDLPERCTGLSSECPEDVFQENGIPCQGGRGYCYNGACPSHAEQCRLLWGAAAQVAPDECFKHNSNQDRNFHCMTESGRRPCSPKDVKCGTLLCMSDASSPALGSGFLTLSFGHYKCKAALDSNDDNEMTGSLQLVPTGTKCGEEMVCYAGRCQNLLVYGKKNCSAKCSGHGVCNHKRECHCELGWAPPYCQHKVLELTAGASSMVLAAVLAVLVLSSILIGGGFVLLRGKGKKYFQKGRISSRPTTGLTNPLFQEGTRPHQLSLRAIGSPSLLSTTAAPRDARPLVPGCPLLQEKPKPPTKPLPALKTKQVAATCPKPCNMAAGEALPPTPPAKPPVLSFQPRAIPVLPQRGVPPKLALKPPASRR